ncbi:hypothetical protein A3709_20770 [Halioglobus sp. HI00S01]|nr:hypothetical protein A3709_20770 [Halioglobus sp. HI00S01]
MTHGNSADLVALIGPDGETLAALREGERYQDEKVFTTNFGRGKESREFRISRSCLWMTVTRDLPSPTGTDSDKSTYYRHLDGGSVILSEAKWSLDTRQCLNRQIYDWRLSEGETLPPEEAKPFALSVEDRATALFVSMPIGGDGDGLYAAFEIREGLPAASIYANIGGDVVANILPRIEDGAIDFFPEGGMRDEGVSFGRRPYPGFTEPPCKLPPRLAMSVKTSTRASEDAA